MIGYRSSTTEISTRLREVCLRTYLTTVGDKARADRIDGLGHRVALLETFISGYECISDPAVDSDDEILNWTFSEVPGDFCAALWNLSTGFYKAAASSLRNGFDLGFASLYFQIRQNINPGAGYNKFFAEWDIGKRQTPSWGETKPIISNQASVRKFNEQHKCNVIDEIYGHFKYLSNYTHTSAFTPEGHPVTAINFAGVSPAFDQQMFERMCSQMEETISWLGIGWQVVFPQIMGTEPLGPTGSPEYDLVLTGLRGEQAKNFQI